MPPKSFFELLETPAVRPCVEGFVFVRGPPRFLLLRRSAARGGWWQSVSGGVEPSDPSRTSAVLREVREETGFTEIVRLEDLNWSVQFPSPVSGRPLRSFTYGVEVPRVRPPRLSEEHVAYGWCDLGTALATLHWPDNREALRRLALLLAVSPTLSRAPSDGT